MSRQFLQMIMTISCVLLLCGCGSRPVQSMDTAEAGGQREKLLLWSYYETEAQKAGLDYLIEEFNQSQTQYELCWEYVPMQDYVKRLSAVVSEQNLPDLVKSMCMILLCRMRIICTWARNI